MGVDGMRHNYDKGWRCPGWSGGGFSTPSPRRDICNGGSFAPHWNKKCKWHFHRCTECGVIAIPLVTRWVDPTWWKWVLESRVWWGIRDWWENDPLAYFIYRWTNPTLVIQRLTRTEWSERWSVWPHCNIQGGCWMHSTTLPWCQCTCMWCRLAKVIRRG